jgi:intergrase/recombinase
MRRTQRKRDALLKKLTQCPEFVRGSISSVCATCNRARCICERKSSTRAYRLTYKDGHQKTKIVYVPRDQLPRMRRMIANYKKVRAIMEEIVETNIAVFKEETRR